jgi:hypothetical protein
MTKEAVLEIGCTSCNTPVKFSLRSLSKPPVICRCEACGKQFGIESGLIARQIKLFVDLCQQLKASEEILSQANVAVSIGSYEVKLPFKLLLTRLRSTLDLDIGGKKVVVSYRTEPLKVAEALKEPENSTL